MLRKVARLLLILPFVFWGYSVTQAQPGCVLLGASSGAGGSAATNNPNGTLVVVNPANGSTTHLCTLAVGFGAMAQHPITGVLYAVTAPGFISPPTTIPRRLMTINPTNCAQTFVGNVGLGNFGIADIAFRPDGTLFAWSENSDDLATINTSTGAGTVIANAGISTFGSGLEFGPGGTTLYLAGGGTSGNFYSVNPATGTTTVLFTLSGFPVSGFPVPAMTFGNGQMYAAMKRTFPPTALTDLVTINLTTGAVTDLGPTLPRTDALAFWCVSLAPTFAAWQTLMLTIVLVTVGYWQLRRRKHIIV
jgi:hypothetical protein